MERVVSSETRERSSLVQGKGGGRQRQGNPLLRTQRTTHWYPLCRFTPASSVEKSTASMP
jgi:hypothetical protein